MSEFAVYSTTQFTLTYTMRGEGASASDPNFLPF